MLVGKTSLTKRSVMLALLVLGVLLGAASAQTESVLYSFCAQKGCMDGEAPEGTPIFDQNGNLYGTTYLGGAYLCGNYGCGVVFKLTPTGKETVLYSFCARTNCTDGEYPAAGVVLDQKGNLYGTTSYGGAHGNGAVFKLTPEGQETILHSFCARNGCTDGGVPYAGLVIDRNGNLYGTATQGGANNNNICRGYGCGVVFKLTPAGKYRVLYSFCAQSNCADGAFPRAGLIFDQKGDLYGTTYGGGACGFEPVGGCGVAFRLTPGGKETVLYSFCAQNRCADGLWPEAGLTFDQKGNLYGTTSWGGNSNQCYPGCGIVFKLTQKGKETVLYNFCVQNYCPDGMFPEAAVVFDQRANLYGTTSEGGGNNGNCLNGCGVLFKLTPKGKETVLYSFCAQGNCTDGDVPSSGLIFDQQGNLYGTTSSGGAYGGAGIGGVVFKLTP